MEEQHDITPEMNTNYKYLKETRTPKNITQGALRRGMEIET